MPKNYSKDHPDYALVRKIQDLEKQLKEIKTNQLTVVVAPQLTADPGTPFEGQIWSNTTTHHLKIYLNGVITTIV